MRPILTIDAREPEKKAKLVEIYKNEVYKDIDLYTHKHVDAREDMGARSANAVSSDNSENVDGAVIARYVEFRDAQLRLELQTVLIDEPAGYASDEITMEDNKYRYWFEVDMDFKDVTLRPLAEYIHRFLVFGALFDWYSQFGMLQQASAYEKQIPLIDDIADILRGPSIVQRPMQPFGPAQKYL